LVKVLIVDDEVRLATLVADGLGRHGIEAEMVHDGAAGVERALETRFDAIVLDILMPKMSGFAVCAAIRAAGADVPILMLTAKDGDLDEAEALDTGADDYLRKPFSLEVLVARLRALVRRTGRSAEAVLVVGDLRLDTQNRSVSRAGVDVELSAKELDLLEVLASRAGQVVSKQALYDSVWGSDRDHRSNVIEVYVSYLRSKIDEPFGLSTIETVRGRGYRLSAAPEAHRTQGDGA
jgi:DNA-binding response OmpR family regulator